MIINVFEARKVVCHSQSDANVIITYINQKWHETGKTEELLLLSENIQETEDNSFYKLKKNFFFVVAHMPSLGIKILFSVCNLNTSIFLLSIKIKSLSKNGILPH